MDRKILTQVLFKIYSVSSKIYQIRGTEIPMKTGIMINTAALSTLDVISKNTEMNMSEISALMGVTKGAISQMALKLERKGLIEKSRVEGNAKNFFLVVTEKGKRTLEEYYVMHDRLYNGMFEVLSGYKEEEVEIIRRFLSQTDDLMDNYKRDTENEHEGLIKYVENYDTKLLNVNKNVCR